MSIYINKKTKKEYKLLDDYVLNKDNNLYMVLYEDENGVKYVRGDYDFSKKFELKNV